LKSSSHFIFIAGAGKRKKRLKKIDMAYAAYILWPCVLLIFGLAASSSLFIHSHGIRFFVTGRKGWAGKIMPARS